MSTHPSGDIELTDVPQVDASLSIADGQSSADSSTTPPLATNSAAGSAAVETTDIIGAAPLAVAPAGQAAAIKASAELPVTASASAAPPKPSDEAQAEQMSTNPNGYLDFLRKLRSVWIDQPDISISWRDLRYRVKVPHTDTSVQTLASALINVAKKPFSGKSSWSYLDALAPSSGVLTPGKMTLILAPPGHGKSTLLKALSGRMQGDSALTGTIKYNGRTASENLANGVYVNRLCAYVGQQDLHFPILTVHETLDFAAKNSIPDANLLRQPPPSNWTMSPEQFNSTVDEVVQLEDKRAALLISLLGMDECSSTIVGNDLLRGVSGGQRKRVTLGEMLLTNSRAYFLDEVTTGLDAAVTVHIFRALQQACRIQQSTVCTALLQPTPETYALFDELVLMRDGRIVYHGPRDQVTKWLWETTGLEVPAGVDEAGFIVDYLTDPHQQYELAHKETEARAEKLARGDIDHQRINVPPTVNGSDQPSQVTFHFEPASDQGDQTSNTKPALQDGAETSGLVSSVKTKQLRQALSSSFEPMYHSTVAASPVYTSDELENRYRHSVWYAQMTTDVDVAESTVKPLDPKSWSPYTKAQYGQKFPHSALRHARMALSRQSKLTGRNRTMIPPRLAQAVIMGLVIGSLFYGLSLNQFSDKMGLLLYVVMFGAFSNMTELPVASEARNVVAKQIDAGFFPAPSYTLSVCLLHIPLTIVEALIFGTLVYWMPHFTSDAGRFFFFLLTFCVNSNALSVFFRSISYVAKNPDVARQMDMPFILLFVIFGGFLITYDKIPNWLVWLYYISPFSWSVQSLALNEFKAPRYDNLISNGEGGFERQGDTYLELFDLRTESIWKWMGIVYLGGFYTIFCCLSMILLSRLRPITPIGTRKTASADHDHPHHANGVANGTNGTGIVAMEPNVTGATIVQVEATDSDSPSSQTRSVKVLPKGLRSNKMSFQLTALPFTPVTLSWKNINYQVEVGSGKSKKWRTLLTDISGFAAPGRMTALMGSSGAGKTTLLDCIAGRKTVGKLEGDILVNGFPKDKATYQRISGYVEQNDIHIATATVREALLFSALMRLPTSVTEEDRIRFVDEVMALLGLTAIKDRLIGDIAIPGLSPGQLKLVTIGVELVANPSVIFLDEPTSGLDAPSAARVMKAVRRIAATGRTVLCTIHQPSEQLFLMFDRLLLLRSGGRVVYFSDIGHKGRALVNYFEAASGHTEKLPRGGKVVQPDGTVQTQLRINPANWMLDVIGAAGESAREAGKVQLDYADLWKDSKLASEANEDIIDACTPKPGSKPITIDATYASGWVRFKAVQERMFTSHWRNPPMNLTRALLLLTIGILLGIIYLQLGIDDFGGVTSLMGVIFSGLSFPSSVIAGSPIPSLLRARAVYYRETTVGLYGYKTFNATIFFAELPYIVIVILLFLIPFYFMIGLVSQFSLFAKFFLMSFLMALTYSSLNQLWLALLPNQIILNVVNGLFMSLFFMFGGLLIKPSSIPIGWKWFYYIDPIPKAFTAVALSQVWCDTEAPGNTCTKIIPTAGSPPVYTYDYMKDLLDSSADMYGAMVGWLILSIGVLRILNLIALKYVSHIKR